MREGDGSLTWLAVAVGPHAEDRPVSNGLRPLWGCFRERMHLNPCALGQLHVFEGLEDAVLVLRCNRHRRLP